MKLINFYTANFVYFTFNFPYGFIKQIFGETAVGEHLQSKFDSYYCDGQNSSLAVLKLFTDMSEDNQERFLNWINTNYCYSKSKKEKIIDKKI